MARAKLIAIQQFAAFGQEYAIGDEIAPAHLKAWPDGTLKRRLDGGFVDYSEAADDEVPAAPQSVKK